MHSCASCAYMLTFILSYKKIRYMHEDVALGYECIVVYRGYLSTQVSLGVMHKCVWIS